MAVSPRRSRTVISRQAPVISRQSPVASRLNAILDAEIAARFGWTIVDLARAFLDGGATFLQLRAKTLSGGEFMSAAQSVVDFGRAYGATIIVNDRADIAAMAGAAGVHLGQEDLAPAAARAIVGERAIVGRSTHTGAPIDAARQEPIDYIAIGPVFGTATKATGYDAVGLEMVRRAVRAGRPVVAIGGVTLDNAASAITAGAASVAVISDLLTGGDPQRRVRDFLARLVHV